MKSYIAIWLSVSATKGAIVVAILAKKLQIPIAVAANKVGNIYALAT